MALGDLFGLYRADPPPHLEESTCKMQEIHFRRLLEVFPKVDIWKFDAASAQTYILTFRTLSGGFESRG